MHFFVPEAGPEIQAWYVKSSAPSRACAGAGRRPAGRETAFRQTDMPAVTTKGRVLDHIGFDVRNLEEHLKKLEAAGIKLDRPYTKNPQTGGALAFIYDPWGTYIELNERKKPL